MLTVIRNEYSGDIEGCCEWTVTDIHGQPCPVGIFCWVAQLDVSRHVDAKVVIKRIIQDILKREPGLAYGYWVRRDKTGMEKQHFFRRSQFEQLVDEEVRV